MYSVLPVGLFDNSVASFILCASPPDSVVEGCPKFNISEGLHHIKFESFVLFLEYY